MWASIGCGWGVCAAVAVLTLGCGDAVIPPHTAARIHSDPLPVPAVQLSVHRSARLFPVDPDRTKRVRLDATYGLVDLGPTGKLAAWSFGGVVPGPTLRVRVGDRVLLMMTNRSEEAIEALRLPSVATHSIRLPGVIIDREDEARAIAPGQTLEVEFTALQPGVHLYGSGAADKAGMASGAFGLLIIEPAEGFATRADREYAIVQNELYAKADPAGRRLGGAPLQVPDLEALTAKRPSHLAFNGQFAPGKPARLDASAGELVRLFVANAGLNVVARFQVPGLPIVRAWPAEIMPPAPGPVLLAPAQGAILEVVIPKKGRYTFSDQQLASRGLSGIIDATGGEPEPVLLVARGPLTPAAKREKARELFTDRCKTCHEPPEGTMRLAPDLVGVAQRRNRQWLMKWLTNPPKMQAEDPDAQQLMRQWNNVPMPDMLLSPEQVEWLTDFLSGSKTPPKTGKAS
jgi:nitrite reductase (NO-forming)